MILYNYKLYNYHIIFSKFRMYMEHFHTLLYENDQAIDQSFGNSHLCFLHWETQISLMNGYIIHIIISFPHSTLRRLLMICYIYFLFAIMFSL